MTSWACSACTYRNINARSTQCIMCSTARYSPTDVVHNDGEAPAPPPVIIDLTELCSPRHDGKPTATRPMHVTSNKDDSGRKICEVVRSGRGESDAEIQECGIVNGADDERFRGGGDIMESARRRRRRLNNYAEKIDEAGNITNISANHLFENQSNGIKSRGSVSDTARVDRNNKCDNPENKNANTTIRKDDKKIMISSKHRSDLEIMLEDEDENDIIVEPCPKQKIPLNFTNDDEKCKREADKASSVRNKSSELGKRKSDEQWITTLDMTSAKQTTSGLKKREAGPQRVDNPGVLFDHNHGTSFKPTNESSNRWTDNEAMYVRNSQKHRNENVANERNISKNDRRIDDSSKSRKDGRLTDFYNKQPTRSLDSFENLTKRASTILRTTFGYKSLRKLQKDAIKGALQQKSQIIIMATGGGKSLCYQLPALVGASDSGKVRAENSCVTIVVCPLVALMVDQVNNLHKKGVLTAACLSSSVSAKAKTEIFQRLQHDKKEAQKGKEQTASQSNSNLTPIQLLYCTPELIETERFRTVLSKLHASNRLHMFAIDEAHCLSTWGHDFRPAYRKLTWVRDAFPEIPIMACTGTATSKVIDDIRDILCLDKKHVPCLMGTFNRENISYEVRFKDSLSVSGPQGAIDDLVSVVKKQHEMAKKANEPCSGIIYVHKREDCKSLAMHITKAAGLVAAPYHAGLKDSEREDTQRKWTDGTICIAVATVAFGMGIDLPHVRYVCHWTMAKSLEGFYQESGRGGRDGKQSLSILYYSKDDASKFAFLVKKNAERAAQKKGKLDGFMSKKTDHSLVELEGMVDYCTKPGCKRKYVLNHFGEKIDANIVCKKTCDYCQDPKKVERAIQASECMSTVVNSQRLMRAGRNGQHQNAQVFHHNPLASDESQDEYETDGFMGSDEGFLGRSDYDEEDDIPSGSPQKGFVKASNVLKKYETMECQSGKKGGFVNFKTRTFDESQEDRDARRHRPIEIPEHLRKDMPDPLAGSYKQAGDAAHSEAKGSGSYASEAERLKAELEALQKEKAAFLAKMRGSIKTGSSQSSKSLSAPSLKFKKRH